MQIPGSQILKFDCNSDISFKFLQCSSSNLRQLFTVSLRPMPLCHHSVTLDSYGDTKCNQKQLTQLKQLNQVNASHTHQCNMSEHTQCLLRMSPDTLVPSISLSLPTHEHKSSQWYNVKLLVYLTIDNLFLANKFRSHSSFLLSHFFFPSTRCQSVGVPRDISVIIWQSGQSWQSFT